MSTTLSMDLTAHPEEARMQAMTQIANQVEAFVKTRFGAEPGCLVTRRTSKPFQERPQLIGHHVFARKGFLRGIEIQIKPHDFQVRQVTIELRRQSRMDEAAVEVPVIVAFVAGIAAAIFVFQQSTSDRGRNVVLTLLLTVLAVSAVGIGITRFLSKALTKAFTDPAKDEREREELWQALLPILDGQ